MATLRRLSWIPAGILVAALVAAGFGSGRAWFLMMLYAAFNLLGTAHMLRILNEPRQYETTSTIVTFIDQRGPMSLKLSFVAQLPLGLVLLMLDGL